MRLAGRQHPRLIDDNSGVSIDNPDPAPCGKTQQLVDAEGTRLNVIAERHRRAPGHGGGDDALSVFTVEIGDGPQCRGFARARRSLDDGDPARRMR